MRKLLSTAAFIAAGMAATRASSLLLLPIYVTYLGVDGYGRLELIFAIAILGSAIFSLQAHESLLGHYSGTPQRVLTASAAISVSGMLAAHGAGLISVEFGLISTEEALALSAYISCLILWQFARNVARIRGNLSKLFQAESLAAGITLVTSAWALALDPRVATATVAIATGAICGAAYALASNRIPPAFPRYTDVRTILGTSAVLLPNVILWWGVELSDRLLLAGMLSNENVAHYSGAYRLSSLLMLPATILYQAWQVPALSLIGRPTKFFQISIDIYTRAMIAMGSILLSAMPIASSVLLGEHFDTTETLASILIPSIVLMAITYPLGITLYRSSSSRSALAAPLIAFILNVLANLLLIPAFQELGAAAATLISFIALFVGRYGYSAHRLGITLLGMKQMLAAFTVLSAQSAAVFLGFEGWIVCVLSILVVGTCLLGLSKSLAQLRIASDTDGSDSLQCAKI